MVAAVPTRLNVRPREEEIVAAINRLGAWMAGDPLILPGGLQTNGPIVFDNTNARIDDSGIDDPANPGQRLVRVNALTVTPGRTHTAGLTVNGPSNLNGEVFASSWFRNSNPNTGLYNETYGFGLQITSNGLLWYGGAKSGQVLATTPTQQLVGAWGPAGSSYSMTGGPWAETTMQFTAGYTGAPYVRIDWNLSWVNTVASALCYIGIGWDGAIGWNIAQISTPAANYGMGHAGSLITTGMGAGSTHRLAVFCGSSSGGTITFQAGVHQWLQATELRQ